MAKPENQPEKHPNESLKLILAREALLIHLVVKHKYVPRSGEEIPSICHQCINLKQIIENYTK